MEFYDSQTGELLLKAGHYWDNPLCTEEMIINKTIEEIRKKFFPQPASPTADGGLASMYNLGHDLHIGSES